MQKWAARGRCRTLCASFAASLLHGVCVLAVPFSICKLSWTGNDLYHRCIHHPPEQWGPHFESKTWASILMTVILIAKISLKGPGAGLHLSGLFWINLSRNKKQMETNKSNSIAGWMFHFKYYCLCEDIQHGCAIVKRNMHWSLHRETGKTLLCKYYFIYCQQL